MENAIRNFAKQFLYEPEIVNGERYQKKEKFILVGMGGSHLAGGLLKIFDPCCNLTVHRNYELPCVRDEELTETTVIASSYSGNTEEVVDAFEKALEKKLNVIAISTGGMLIEKAKEHSLPYIELPATGIQPRSALGFALRAVFKVVGKEEMLKVSRELAETLKPEAYEAEGNALAEALRGHVPVIYASANNEGLAHNWKIKFNETGKIPAFYNVFPELNHNEMTGFDVRESSKDLSEKFSFVFLKDASDHPRTLKRMEVLEKQYAARGFSVKICGLTEKNIFLKIFSSLILADWTALYTAKFYGLEPGNVPMVEEFKKLMT